MARQTPSFPCEEISRLAAVTRHLGIDPSTLAAYEQGRQPAKEMRNLLEKALKALIS